MADSSTQHVIVELLTRPEISTVDDLYTEIGGETATQAEIEAVIEELVATGHVVRRSDATLELTYQ